MQTGTGKANAVWDSLKIASGDLIAILDADISVDPETIPKFLKLLNLTAADFVMNKINLSNGKRVYEKN